MSLDFTALDSIPSTEGNLARKPEATGGALHRLDREKQDRENARQIYVTYQRNIQRAGMLRTDIAKGIQSGSNPLDILLKALECISLMTGDAVLYEQGKKDLLAVYGWGLRDPAPLRLELEEAQARLTMLTRPELAQTTTEEQKRIQRAVEAHRGLIERLEREITA